MELLPLQYFQTVARLEHMTKAAEELRIAQLALSKTIARLEEDLGVPLFDRQNRHIRLNAFGKAFLQKVETALRHWRKEDGKQRIWRGASAAGLIWRQLPWSGCPSPWAPFVSNTRKCTFASPRLPLQRWRKWVGSWKKEKRTLVLLPCPYNRRVQEMPVPRTEVCLAVPPGHRLEGRESIHLREVAKETFSRIQRGAPLPQNQRPVLPAGRNQAEHGLRGGGTGRFIQPRTCRPGCGVCADERKGQSAFSRAAHGRSRLRARLHGLLPGKTLPLSGRAKVSGFPRRVFCVMQ